MKMQYLVPIIALMLIVSVSGCVEGFDISSMWGGFNEPTEIESPDLITMREINVYPDPPIIAGNEFTVLFKMKNQDISETVDDVEVKLYDWGTCTPLADEFLPIETGWIGMPEGALKSNYYIQTFDEVYPNEEKVIEFRFRSPDNEKIANIKAVCPVKWEINYTFSAKSNDDFTVISKTRNEDLQRSDTDWAGTNQPQFIGIGPVKIQYSFITQMPAQTNSSIQYTLQVFDQGEGIYSEVKKGTMFVKVPLEWLPENLDDANSSCTGAFGLLTLESGEVSGYTSGIGYTSWGITASVVADIKLEEGYAVFQNIKDINLYDRETHKIICRFKAPDLDIDNIPEKTYFLSANITDYYYRLTEDQSVMIEPMV